MAAPQDLDPELIAEALTKAEGSTIRAAKALGVRAHALRLFCLREPRLMEAAFEASELALDKAEASVFRALRTGPLSNRLQAAAFIVKSRGRRR